MRTSNWPRKKVGQLCTRDKRCRTGCVGVSLTTINEPRAHGPKPRTYFQALAGKRRRKFCVDTLGRHEAWRRAVQYRADYELKIRTEATERTEKEIKRVKALPTPCPQRPRCEPLPGKVVAA